MRLGLVDHGTGGPNFLLAAAQDLNLIGTDILVHSVLAGRRPADDLAGWRFENPDLLGTLSTKDRAEHTPTEQGCYHTSDDAFAPAVRMGSALPVTAAEAIQILAVPDVARLSATERRSILLS